MNKELIDFIQFTHKYSPLIGMVVDTRSGYYGKFYLSKGVEIKYLTIEELYEFWKQEGQQWIENIAKPKLGLK